MLVTPQQMIAAENEWLENGGDAAELMQVAGDGIARSITSFFSVNSTPGTMILVLGPGNNAGDACVAARTFAQRGWLIRWMQAFPTKPLSSLTHQYLKDLGESAIPLDPAHDEISDRLPRPLVVIDGLLGVGARLPLEGSILEAAKHINSWRRNHGAFTVSIDIPTGLDGETGTADENAVIADLTTCIGTTKSGLIADSAGNYVGRLATIPLPSLQFRSDTGDCVFQPSDAIDYLDPSPHVTWKTRAGRVLIIAGSPEMTGAAALTAKAALRTGAGMVTVLSDPRCISEIALRSSPEVMVRSLNAYQQINWEKFDALCVGPGLGNSFDQEIDEILSQCPLPTLIDADAINVISRMSSHRRDRALSTPLAPRLITPHHQELIRIFPEAESSPSREKTARSFINRFPETTLLYKGSRTIVCRNRGTNSPLWYNPTGHSGMASAGMGDTLSGICTTLLAKNWDIRPAASTGAWLHGRAAEIATYSQSPRTSTESLIASDVIDHIGAAWIDLHEHLTY